MLNESNDADKAHLLKAETDRLPLALSCGITVGAAVIVWLLSQ